MQDTLVPTFVKAIERSVRMACRTWIERKVQGCTDNESDRACQDKGEAYKSSTSAELRRVFQIFLADLDSSHQIDIVAP
jgi:hypothetical protein